MIRNIVLLAALFGCTISAPLNYKEEFKEYMIEDIHPLEFLEFYDSFNYAEKTILKEIKPDHIIGEDPTEYLAAVKLALPQHYAEVKEHTRFFNNLFAKLPLKAQKFVQDVIRGYKQAKKDVSPQKELKVKLYLEQAAKYDALSAEEKTELKKSFAMFDLLYAEGSDVRESYKPKFPHTSKELY